MSIDLQVEITVTKGTIDDKGAFKADADDAQKYKSDVYITADTHYAWEIAVQPTHTTRKQGDWQRLYVEAGQQRYLRLLSISPTQPKPADSDGTPAPPV